jgi:sugar lactone lactonase YvrE
MKRVLAVAACLLALIPSVAGASAHVETLITFNPAAGELPEGVAVDKVGNVFVSLAPLGQLIKLEPGSATPESFGVVPNVNPVTDLGLLGLAVDARGDVYGAVVAAASQGVWRFDRTTGASSRIPGTQAIPFPNGLAFDKRGNLYVASSFEGLSPSGSPLGGVWRIAGSGVVERVLVSELLGGTGALVPPGIGANGVAYRQGSLYVTNTEKGTLLNVPVGPNGDLGMPQVVASGPQLSGSDGLALDVHGNIYVAVIAQSTIVRVSQDGAVDLVADGSDGLDWASSLAFGTGKGNRQQLFAVNFSIGPLFGAPRGAGPALLKVGVGVPGQPLP